MSVYGISEDEIKSLNREYKKIRDGYQIKVRNTKEATKLIVEHQDLFTDYEVVKGGMDDVFLAVTGKKLGGELMRTVLALMDRNRKLFLKIKVCCLHQ